MNIRRNIYICAVAGLLAVALYPHAEAAESLSLGLSAEQGGCFEAGETVATAAVSAEYRLDGESLDAHGYGRWAPTGLDCTRDGFTADVQVQRTWDLGRVHAVAQFGAEQAATVGAYSIDGAGDVWRYLVDGTPVFAAAAGVGGESGDVAWWVSANAVPTDWVDGSSHGLRAGASWTPEVLGGDLLLEVTTEAARRFSYLAQWSRQFGDGPLGVTASWRVEDGLDELAPPFEAMLPGGWRLGPGSPRTTLVEIALSWEI